MQEDNNHAIYKINISSSVFKLSPSKIVLIYPLFSVLKSRDYGYDYSCSGSVWGQFWRILKHVKLIIL